MPTPRDSQRSKFLRAWYETRNAHPATFREPRQRNQWCMKLRELLPKHAPGRTASFYAGDLDRWSLVYEMAVSSHRANEAPHGRESAALALKFVQTCIGKQAASALRDAFKREGVKYRAAPKLTDEERERRRQAGQRLQDHKAAELVAAHREVIKARMGIG
jgi:hypothetical protein